MNIKENATDYRYVEFQHNQLPLFKEDAFNQVFKIPSSFISFQVYKCTELLPVPPPRDTIAHALGDPQTFYTTKHYQK